MDLRSASKGSSQRVSLLSSLRRLKSQAEQSAKFTITAKAEQSTQTLFKKSGEVTCRRNRVFTSINEEREHDQHDAEDSRLLSARYHELVKDIDIAFRGKLAPVMPVNANETIAGIIGPAAEMDARKYYALTLPDRASKIVVFVKRISGPIPQMYASSTVERPSAETFDLETDDGELFYNHEPEGYDDANFPEEPEPSSPSSPLSPSSKKKKAALYVCVESSRDVSEFRLRCSVRRKQEKTFIASEGDQPKAQADARLPRSRLLQRLAELTCEPEARKQFNQHLVALKTKRQEGWRHDFKAINRSAAESESKPEMKKAKIQDRKVQRLERMQQAAIRYEEKEALMEERAMWWVGRDEEKKRLRVEEALRQEEEERLATLRSAWLEKLIVIGWGKKLFDESLKAKTKHVRDQKELHASQQIQNFSIAKLSQWRRVTLYRNVIKVRIAMHAYIRHCRHGVAAVAAAPVTDFLNTLVHRIDHPDMLCIIKRFKLYVQIVQRNFRRLKVMRHARADALRRFFLASELIDEEDIPLFGLMNMAAAVQEETYDEHTAHTRRRPSKVAYRRSSTSVEKHEEVKLDSHSRKIIQAAEKRKTQTALMTAEATGSRPVSASTRRPSKDSGGKPAWVRDYRGEELLPLVVRKAALYKHVSEMQRTLAQRLEKWKQDRKEHMVEEDLIRMGLATGEEDPTGRLMVRRPRVVEFEMLKPLYTETYDAYLRGDYIPLIHDTRTKMKKVFTLWRRASNRMSLINIDTAATNEIVKAAAESDMSASQVREYRQTLRAKKITLNRTVTKAFGLGEAIR